MRWPISSCSDGSPVWWTLWIVWLLACVMGVIWWSLPVGWSRALFTAFLLAEAWGALRGGRMADTLSELLQWVDRRGHPDAPWYLSWKVVPIGVCVLVAWQAGWTAAYWREPYDRWPAGVIVGLLILLWNLPHYLNRERYG